MLGSEQYTNGLAVAADSPIGYAAEKLRRVWKQRGLWGTTRFILSRICRRQVSLVFEASLTQSRPAALWNNDERLLQFGPENIDSEMNPALERFLGWQAAIENIKSVRNGDRLFVVEAGGRYLHRGYILFHTRENKLIGQLPDTPLIGYCFTSPEARGRGLYRKALLEELNYLQRHGYSRVAIVTSPENAASRKGIESATFSLAWEARIWVFLNLVGFRCIITQSEKRWTAIRL